MAMLSSRARWINEATDTVIEELLSGVLGYRDFQRLLGLPARLHRQFLHSAGVDLYIVPYETSRLIVLRTIDNEFLRARVVKYDPIFDRVEVEGLSEKRFRELMEHLKRHFSSSLH